MRRDDRRDGPEFMALRPEFRDSFPWAHADLTWDAFRTWARSKRSPGLNVPARQWRPMKDGEPVPRPTIEAFSEYVGDVLHILPAADCLVSRIATACEPPPAGGDERAAAGVSWRAGWGSIYARLARAFTAEADAFCSDERDLRHAAKMIMLCMANHDGLRLSEAQAIARSEAEIRMSPDEYVALMRRFWAVNEHAVMFHSVRIRQVVHRAGVSVAVPITERYRDRLYRGEVDVHTFDDDDICGRSDIVLIHAVAENPDIDIRRDKARRTFSQIQRALYQVAAMLNPVGHGQSPCIVTYTGSEENTRRARAFGFRSVGVKTPIRGVEILEFKRPTVDEQGFRTGPILAEYLALRSLLEVYQSFIGSEQARDAEQDGPPSRP